jgi:hypothetical protein
VSESNYWRIASVLGWSLGKEYGPVAYGYDPLHNEVSFFLGKSGFNYRYHAYVVAGRQYGQNQIAIEGPMTWDYWRTHHGVTPGGWW